MLPTILWVVCQLIEYLKDKTLENSEKGVRRRSDVSEKNTITSPWYNRTRDFMTVLENLQ